MFLTKEVQTLQRKNIYFEKQKQQQEQKNGACSGRKKGTLTPLRSPGYSGYWWNEPKRLVLGKEI